MASVARRSSFALILVLTLLAALAVQRSDAAGAKNVSMSDNDFVPASTIIRLGDTVEWSNNGHNPHTATGNAPLSLWNSGRLDRSERFRLAFKASGTYPYFCDFHDISGMVGRVAVLIRASVNSGAVGTVFRLTVATANAVAPFRYDVQMKPPGGSYTNYKPGTVKATVSFNSTGRATGEYQFRARLRNTTTGAVSGWSPARSITVTP